MSNPEGIFGREISRRRLLRRAGELAVGLGGAALVGCEPQEPKPDVFSAPPGSITIETPTSRPTVSRPKTEGKQTLPSSTAENVKTILPGEVGIRIDSLPNNASELVANNALPAKIVLRKGCVILPVGIFKQETGENSVVCMVEDPQRRASDGSNQKFTAVFSDSAQAVNGQGSTSFDELVFSNNGRYDKSNGVFTLGDGAKYKLPTLSSVDFTAQKDKAGVFFVDRDPLRKGHPLLEKPVIPVPDKAILPDGGSITQLEDGRVVTKDASGRIIARAISQKGDTDWWWTQKDHLVNDFSIRELSEVMGFSVVGFGLWQDINRPEYVEAARSMFSRLKLGDTLRNNLLISRSMDWKKVLSNWDDTKAKLAQGVIPFENEVFSPGMVSRTDQMIEFARENGMDVIGQNLILWNYNIDAMFSPDYSPDEKRKMLEFIVKAKVLKFRGRIKEWIVSSEVANSEMPWADPKWRSLYAGLGGRKLIHDAFVWAREADPNLTTVLVENHTADANNDAHIRTRDNSDDLLKYFNQQRTPIDKVSEENNFWIYAPPAPGEIRARYEKIKAMGYKIGSSEMAVSVSEKFPGFATRPRTVGVVANKEEAQAQIVKDALEAALATSEEFGVFSGTDADTWHNYEGFTDSQPEILDARYNAKPAYRTIVATLKRQLA